jgi:hypothetical protein
VSRDEFISAGMKIFITKGTGTIAWLHDGAALQGWQHKIQAMISLYRLGFDTGLTKDPQDSISAQELIDDSIEMAQFVNITDEEKTWLKVMSWPDRVTLAEYKKIFWNAAGAQFMGLLDKTYDDALKTNEYVYLKPAEQYYLSTRNLPELIFPLSPELKNKIDSEYRNIVGKAESMAKDMNVAVVEAQAKWKDQDLRIRYHIGLNGNEDELYNPTLDDSDKSFLLTKDLSKHIDSQLFNFHTKRTAQFYKTGANGK